MEFYRGRDGKTKKRILSCIFSGKIYFQENGDAAISYHQPIVVLMTASKVLEGSENKKEVISDLLFNMTPLTGEICSHNAMIEYVTIRELNDLTYFNFAESDSLSIFQYFLDFIHFISCNLIPTVCLRPMPLPPGAEPCTWVGVLYTNH